MTSLPLPLPPDDPRQVRALEAIDPTGGKFGLSTLGLGLILAAYFSALQTEGVRLVAAPPCKACEGSGDQVEYRMAKDYAAEDIRRDCPRCNGSGLARMVALDDVEEWLGAAGWSTSTSPEYLADLFARRFSGTGEEPHG